jgi:hypothetical protein
VELPPVAPGVQEWPWLPTNAIQGDIDKNTPCASPGYSRIRGQLAATERTGELASGSAPAALRALILIGFTASLTLACGGGEDKADKTADSLVLDPATPHYGLSNDEWGADWWKWIYELPQEDVDDCVIPIEDATGEDCAHGQSGEVFFLAGTSAGVAVRDECTVPSGKAIYFPIVTFTADNAGIPPDQQLSNAELKEIVRSLLDEVPVEQLAVEYDGKPISNLARFRTSVTRFEYELPPEPNVYTCLGAVGVEGTIGPAFAAGYYVMLEPPGTGDHVLHFEGHSPESNPPLTVDVTYEFTVQ